MEVKEMLQQIRDAGYSIQDIAREVGVHYLTVYRWLWGERRPHPRSRYEIEELYHRVVVRPGRVRR